MQSDVMAHCINDLGGYGCVGRVCVWVCVWVWVGVGEEGRLYGGGGYPDTDSVH